jgi:predicted anti-sigma-YlaC factor YlaD
MSRAFVVAFAAGLIVAVFGLIWALQGFGVLGGSPMSNTTTWSIIGPITVLIGLVIAVFSWRRISSAGPVRHPDRANIDGEDLPEASK